MISPTYPGVYVEEIDTFPASVAAVATAIPAFLGYVQRAERAGRSLLRTEAGTVTIEPVRIGSLLEFEEVFGGGAAAASVNVALDATNQVKSVDVTPSFYLHASMRGFFDNGGGNCWIVPIGLYGDTRGGTPDAAHFTEGLDAIAKVDEPTLLVAPDAMLLASPGDRPPGDARPERQAERPLRHSRRAARQGRHPARRRRHHGLPRRYRHRGPALRGSLLPASPHELPAQRRAGRYQAHAGWGQYRV